MWGQRVYGKFLYLLLNFAVNLELLLKIKSIKNKLTIKNNNKEDNRITLIEEYGA